MKARRAIKWLDERGAAAVLAAASEIEARQVMREKETELWNGVRLVLLEHEGRLVDLEDWRALVEKYLQTRGRPKKG